MRPLDTNLLLRAYAAGIFPMADSRRARDVYWVEPAMRGILPLDRFHLSRSLAKVVRSDRFAVTADQVFARVIAACAEARQGAQGTWINAQIEQACNELHLRGHAHSVESWQDGALVGGLYGVSLGGAFFGESMFSRARDASKVALAHLVARLKIGGYRLLDCQFLTDHLASLGAIEVSRDTYVGLLGEALGLGAGAGSGVASDWGALDRLAGALPEGADPDDTRTVSGPISGQVIVQLLGQTS
ncbi:leucyl/phenylalanyl-tRNA--protein transferase [Sphingomonas sp. MAH-20]|uniref:Leucyl/phenylalanyl-tRNA--protein transferase n=1 Tax=Sphingomonas horti TaxID=2682842 RepID=A0A6I4IZ04_9SPHN|nr:leucyl/phenylalanyl-tRNA--protein transferase [Sphingomonas sp. CGMCC 1.13658]MBA2918339.1 leucyl/phenylalanyl-tRNA--protein transferase [Sphingomonas sp. CGMCC 1.13658]MVO77306.1 leucyl/phenylalanyl-tRNA--protein transferase [Sphingomonas horti]